MSSLKDRLKYRYAHVEREEDDIHSYQWRAVDFLMRTPFSALFVDTGLGKTIIVLTLIVQLIQSFLTRKVLVVAPVRVAAQGWPNEFAAWMHLAGINYTVIRAEDDDPEVISAGRKATAGDFTADLAKRRAVLLELGDSPEGAEAHCKWLLPRLKARAAGKARTRRKEELRQERRKSTPLVHIIDLHHLEWLIDQHSEWVVKKSGKRKVRVRKIVDWPYDTVILDESSAFKDHRIGRFNALKAVRAQGFIKRMHQLTATPAAEGYEGLFAQIFLLDLGERLGRGITRYLNEHFKYDKYKKTHTLMPGQKEVISAKIADICLVMKEEDYLPSTKPLELDRKITLSPEELAKYKKFERDFVMTIPDDEIEDGEVVIEAKTAADLSSKLLQLASGAVYDSDKKARAFHNHKIEDLRELRDELQGSPLMVAYWYKSSLARLKKAFPDAVVMDKAGKLAARHGPWNQGKIKMLLVHPASVGHGLNMQYGPGRDLYMFDMCWSYELYYQLYRRLARQGQKKGVRVHLPQVRGTNDERVAERLKAKEDAQEVLFEYIRRLRRRMAANDNAKMRKAA